MTAIDRERAAEQQQRAQPARALVALLRGRRDRARGSARASAAGAASAAFPTRPTTAPASGGTTGEDRAAVERELGADDEGDHGQQPGDRADQRAEAQRDQRRDDRHERARAACRPSRRPSCSGKPRARSSIAAASISGPDMKRLPLVEVGCRSWAAAAVAPTTTILPRTAAGSKRPASTSAKLSAGNVPAGPGSRSTPSLPGRRRDACARASSRRRRARSCAASADANGMRRIRPSASFVVGRVAGRGAAVLEPLAAAEDARRAVVVDLGRAEHDLRRRRRRPRSARCRRRRRRSSSVNWTS